MSRRSDLKYGSSYGAGGVGKMPQTVNMAKAVLCVAGKQPFSGNNCHARWVVQMPPITDGWIINHNLLPKTPLPKAEINKNYVVYTGTPEHAFPLFVYDSKADIWCENEDDLYGSITAYQRKRLRPQGEIHIFDAETVDFIAQAGFAHVAKMRLQRKDDWRKTLRGYLASIEHTKIAWSRRATLDDWRKLHIINDGGEGT
jgi:hypothetical protein